MSTVPGQGKGQCYRAFTELVLEGQGRLWHLELQEAFIFRGGAEPALSLPASQSKCPLKFSPSPSLLVDGV